MRNVIFTADDYGVVSQIDEGIRDAVRTGMINSVAILSNVAEDRVPEWRSSVVRLLQAGEEAKKLWPGYQLEIGIHLTLTSGFALKGSEPALCKKGSREFNSIFHFAFVDDAQAVYEEIEAQYDRLADLLEELYEDPEGPLHYKIMHLSSHHSILTVHRPHFQALLKLAKAKRAPIRSPIIYPYLDAGLFKRIVTVRNVEDNGSAIIRKIRQYREEFIQDFDRERAGMKKPDLLDCSHAEPSASPFARLRSPAVQAEKKKRQLLKTLEKKQHWAANREFVFHLIKHDPALKSPSQTKLWVRDYPGLNHRSFRERLIESRSLLSLSREEMAAAGVRFSRWADL